MALTPPRNPHRDMMMRSRFGFAETQVIILRHEQQGMPLGVVTPDGVILALGFTVPEDASARIPDGVPARLLSIPVHQLLRRLPEEWGLIVDIDRPHPQVVAPNEKPDVIASSGPFPVGARVDLDHITRRDRAFVEQLRERTSGAAGVSRVWVFRHTVETLPQDLLVVVAADGDESVLRYADAVYEVARSANVPESVVTTWIDELPVEYAVWIRSQEPVIEPPVAG